MIKVDSESAMSTPMFNKHKKREEGHYQQLA
jgi:hypothetical protein